MKKGLIIFLVFAVVFVLVLAFSGIFNPKGTTVATLNVKTTNTTVIVKDSLDNVLSNEGSILTIGDTYTFEIIPNTSYKLTSLTLNNASILNELENNTYSFVCNGNISIVGVSTYIQSIQPNSETCSVTFYEVYEFGLPKDQQYLQTMIYDSNENLVACLNISESCELLRGETYRLEGFYKGNYNALLVFNINENPLPNGTFQLEHDTFLKMNLM